MTSTTRHPPPRDLCIESEILFIQQLLDAPNGIAGLTSAPPPFDKRPFRDGGKWRGDIPKALVRRGIISAVSAKAGTVAAPAERPTRNGTCIKVWRLIDRSAAERRLAELTARRKRPADPSLFDRCDD